MLGASLPDHICDVDLCTQSGVEFAQANLDVGTQPRYHVDALEQFATQLLLCPFGQSSGLRERELKYLGHHFY